MHYKIFFMMIFFPLSIFAQDKMNTNYPVNIATWNLRIKTMKDIGVRSWKNRKSDIAQIIHKYDFDVLGVQELRNKNQLNDIWNLLPEYNFLGSSSNYQAGSKIEQVGIFYKKDRFQLLDSGSFFLSATPNIQSKGWDASVKRICIWSKMKEIVTREEFYVYCTHFDHIGVIARQESSKLLVHKILEQNKENLPVFALGDFNCSPNNTETYSYLVSYFKDAKEASESKPKGPDGTFNDFNVQKDNFKDDQRIDYIMCRKIKILSYEVINYKLNNSTYPSDHFPVMVEFIIK